MTNTASPSGYRSLPELISSGMSISLSITWESYFPNAMAITLAHSCAWPSLETCWSSKTAKKAHGATSGSQRGVFWTTRTDPYWTLWHVKAERIFKSGRRDSRGRLSHVFSTIRTEGLVIWWPCKRSNSSSTTAKIIVRRFWSHEMKKPLVQAKTPLRSQVDVNLYCIMEASRALGKWHAVEDNWEQSAGKILIVKCATLVFRIWSSQTGDCPPVTRECLKAWSPVEEV